jgi:hypothetical protein
MQYFDGYVIFSFYGIGGANVIYIGDYKQANVIYIGDYKQATFLNANNSRFHQVPAENLYDYQNWYQYVGDYQ